MYKFICCFMATILTLALVGCGPTHKPLGKPPLTVAPLEIIHGEWANGYSITLTHTAAARRIASFTVWTPDKQVYSMVANEHLIKAVDGKPTVFLDIERVVWTDGRRRYLEFKNSGMYLREVAEPKFRTTKPRFTSIWATIKDYRMNIVYENETGVVMMGDIWAPDGRLFKKVVGDTVVYRSWPTPDYFDTAHTKWDDGKTREIWDDGTVAFVIEK